MKALLVVAVVILFIVLASVHYSSSKQVDLNPKCADFKTGVFLFYNEVSRHTTLIIRNDSIQREYLNDTVFSSFKINWLNECSYELEFLKCSEPRLNQFHAQKTTVKIISFKQDTCIFSIKQDSMSPVMGWGLKKKQTENPLLKS